MKNTINRWLETLKSLLGCLFDFEAERKYPLLRVSWISGLFLSGVLLYGVFFNWGQFPLDFHDWAEISAARLAFLQDAVIKGVLPLHMPDATALRGVTDRFMVIPDMLLSPQLQLLRFMDVGRFVLVNVILLYALGFWGLLQIRRKFSISLVVFSALFLLFNFNGHILSHFSVGHMTWGGYFLFPWFVLLIIELLHGDRSWKWVAAAAGLLLLIFLQGSFHHYVWALLFLGFLGLTRWTLFPQVFKTLVFAVLVSMVRILPPTLEMGKFDTEYLGGYPTLAHLFQALISIVPPQEALSGRSPLTVLGWWEFDLHIGLAGGLLLLAGIYLWLKNRKQEDGYPELLFPVGLLSILSIGNLYRLVTLTQIPILAAERVSSRLIILPFVFVIILGTIQCQNWLRSRKDQLPLQIGVLALVLLLLHDLWQYIRLWRIAYAYNYFPYTPVDLSIKLVANRPDPEYVNVLIIGGLISLSALFFLFFKAWQEARRKTG